MNSVTIIPTKKKMTARQRDANQAFLIRDEVVLERLPRNYAEVDRESHAEHRVVQHEPKCLGPVVCAVLQEPRSSSSITLSVALLAVGAFLGLQRIFSRCDHTSAAVILETILLTSTKAYIDCASVLNQPWTQRCGAISLASLGGAG